MKCIYCLQERTAKDFKKREHVISQCFGTFTPDNLILYQSVCDECNQYFGDKIELYLGRDTIEGIERYKHGIKPRKQPKHKRIKFKIAEGQLAGIIVTPKYSEGKDIIDIEPVLQVGIFNKLLNRFDYYELDDIPAFDQLKKQGRELKGLKFDFIYKDKHELNILLERLKGKGYKEVKMDTDKEWPDFVKRRNQTLVAGEIKIDRIIYRGICKIVFNYLTYIQGKEFVLSSNFDEIRNFIRYDKGNYNDFFFVNQPHILANDRKLSKFNAKETCGHLVVLGWNGMTLQGRISLFNLNAYKIRASF